MHDIVIRGGSIVDGTGVPRRTGDIAIEGDRIVAVGGKAGRARRDIDADGLLVTPGWVDVHTHYDGQATWDPLLTPSSNLGSTTVLFGNCGVGFAPARPRDRDSLIDLMEGVEDIPGIALAEGLKWDWESFPEFLDALERQERTIDVGAQIPHHPLRVYVMGERAIRREPATREDIAEMRRLTEEAMRAGAFGFTTSRTNSHKTLSGDLVPGRDAEVDELLGIGKALESFDYGAFGMNSDFDDEALELDWMTQLAKETRRPVWFLLIDHALDPQRWRRLIAGVHAARAKGADITAQVAGRPIGSILGLTTSMTPFSIRPAFAALEKLPFEQLLARLRDPTVRREILDQAPSPELLSKLPQFRQQIATRWDRMYVLGDPPDYEPEADRSIAAIAARDGKRPDEAAYDYLTGGDGKRLLFFPTVNYVTGDHEPVREMLLDSATMLGLSDGGAHCGLISDASVPTFMLTHWARDRRRGPGLQLEWVVKRQTSETADFFGLKDRGRVAPGQRADLNLIAFNDLTLHAPEIVHDLPAGGRRLMQRADGYEMTLVAGTPVFERGQHTGAMPGKLVRAGRP